MAVEIWRCNWRIILERLLGMPGEFALTRQNSSHGSPSLPRHPAIRLRHPVFSSLIRVREERWIEREKSRANRQTAGMRAFSSNLLSPVHPFVSPSISTNWINRSQRCTVARRTAWRARTYTHIAPTDPHELHISSLHMNAARRPDPPGRNILPRAMSRAIYVRLCRCARECAHVRFCGTGRQDGNREGRAERGGRKKGWVRLVVITSVRLPLFC